MSWNSIQANAFIASNPGSGLYGTPNAFPSAVHQQGAMNMSSDNTRRYVVLAILFWFVSALVAGWFGLFALPGQPRILLAVFFVLPVLLFPVNVIPAFFVPLFILLHVLALVRRNEVRATATGGSRECLAWAVLGLCRLSRGTYGRDSAGEQFGRTHSAALSFKTLLWSSPSKLVHGREGRDIEPQSRQHFEQHGVVP